MNTRVASMKRLMEDFNGRGFNIKGLFLTEFAGRSDGDGLCRSLEQQRGWMEVLVPMLNEDPAIIAYSWFSYGEGRSPYFHDNANLWDYRTNRLNLLGESYFRVCSGTATPTTPAVLPPHPKPGGKTGEGGHFWLWFLLFLGGIALSIVAGALFKYHRERCGAHVLYEDTTPCNSSSSESDGGSWTEFEAVESDLALPSEVREVIESACNCVTNMTHFENHSESTFTKLRRNLLSLPVRPLEKVSADATTVTLSNIPHKHKVWQFIMLFSEKRRFYRAQAEELSKRLEQNTQWMQVLDRDSSLRQRRASLHGSVR